MKRALRSKNWAPELELDSIVDSRPNPEQQAADSQRRKQIVSVFRALPEQDRQCLALRTEGLRYREIAEVLGLSLGSVSVSVARSLARFARSAGD